MADLQRGDYLDPDRGRMLLRRVAAEWQPVRVTQRPSTLASYEVLLRVHILPFFGDRQVAGISPHDIRRFLAHQVNPIGDRRLNLMPEGYVRP